MPRKRNINAASSASARLKKRSVQMNYESLYPGYKNRKKAFQNVVIAKDHRKELLAKGVKTTIRSSESYYVNLVKERLKSGIYRTEKNSLGRGRLWNVFGVIIRDDGSLLEGWVSCLTCPDVLLFDGKHYFKIKQHPCYVKYENSVVNGSESDVSTYVQMASSRNKSSNLLRTRSTAAAKSDENSVEANNNDLENRTNILETSRDHLETSSTPLESSCVQMEMSSNQMEVASLSSSESGSLYTENLHLNEKLSSAHKLEALCVCANWLVKDCLPTNIMVTKSFEKLSAFFIKMGACYGEHLDASALIPIPGLLTQTIHEAALRKRKIFKRTVQQVFETGAGAVSLYAWQDDYVKKHFVSAILHFEQNYTLFAVALGIKSLNLSNHNKTNLRLKIESIFGKYNVNNLDNIVFVVNSEKTLNAALAGQTVLKCSCQTLTTVIDAAIDATEQIVEIIQYCRELIKQLKEDNLQKLLCTSTKNKHNTTGWLRCHAMFKAIVQNWPKLQKIFAESPELCLGINLNLLSALTEFFENCELVYDKLHCHISPSLCFVIPSINKMNEICQNTYNEENIELTPLIDLKKNILQNLEKNWTNNINIYHKTACFLFPPAIGMQNSRTVEEVKNFCAKQMMNGKLTYVPMTNLLDVSMTNKIPTTIVKPKSDKKAMHFFFPNLGTGKEKEETAEQEVSRYAEETIRVDDDFDALIWWKNNLRNYPRLSKLALHILTIPASCSASERTCKLVGNMNTDKSHIFDSKPFEDILLLHMTDQEDICDFISK